MPAVDEGKWIDSMPDGMQAATMKMDDQIARLKMNIWDLLLLFSRYRVGYDSVCSIVQGPSHWCTFSRRFGSDNNCMAVADPWGAKGATACKTCYQTQFGVSNHTKINSGRGFALDPTGGAYSAPPESGPSWWGGAGCLLRPPRFLGPQASPPLSQRFWIAPVHGRR